MARPKTDPWYIQQIGPLVEQGLRAPRITRELEERARAAKPSRQDCPSERTVARLVDEYEKLPEPVRREQARFSWPQTMESGALPWEASQAALELLCHSDTWGSGRPTVREVKWFWRLRMASPTLSPREAAETAFALALGEYCKIAKTGAVVEVPGLEWLLAYQPWASEENRNAFNNVARQHDIREWSANSVMGWSATGPTADSLKPVTQWFSRFAGGGYPAPTGDAAVLSGTNPSVTTSLPTGDVGVLSEEMADSLPSQLEGNEASSRDQGDSSREKEAD